MFNYVWPLGLVVLSNVFYQICAKSVPEGMNPLASLTITYLIGAAASVILYYVLNKDIYKDQIMSFLRYLPSWSAQDMGI